MTQTRTRRNQSWPDELHSSCERASPASAGSGPTPPGRGQSDKKRHGVRTGTSALRSLRRSTHLERLGVMKLRTTCLPPGGVEVHSLREASGWVRPIGATDRNTPRWIPAGHALPWGLQQASGACAGERATVVTERDRHRHHDHCARMSTDGPSQAAACRQRACMRGRSRRG